MKRKQTKSIICTTVICVHLIKRTVEMRKKNVFFFQFVHHFIVWQTSNSWIHIVFFFVCFVLLTPGWSEFSFRFHYVHCWNFRKAVFTISKVFFPFSMLRADNLMKDGSFEWSDHSNVFIEFFNFLTYYFFVSIILFPRTLQ